MRHRSYVRSLLLLLSAFSAAVNASTVTHEGEHVACRKASCLPASADDARAGYIFGFAGGLDESPKPPQFDGNGHAVHGNGKGYGPGEIPPRGLPEVIHTGAGMDIFPGQPAPAAVPAPAALWLLISGIAGLGLSACGRRRH